MGLRRMVSEILVALLLASVFGTAFYVQPIDANAQVESVEPVPSISQRARAFTS